MRINFYGIRGSLPAGITAETVEKKLTTALNLFVEEGHKTADEIPGFVQSLPFHIRGTYGPSTTCIEIKTDEGSIIFDAGSGLRPYGLKHYQNVHEYHIFFTHFHWDHTCGLPFFIPMYIPGKNIHFYASQDQFEENVKMLFRGPCFPVPYEALPSKHHFHHLNKYETIHLYGLEITPFQLDHPNTAFGYHVKHKDKRLLVCFDTEFKRMSRADLGQDLEYYQNADMILFDGQYTITEVLQKIDWGHCTAQVGVDLCMRENINKLVIVHHDPTSDDEKIHNVSRVVNDYYTKNFKDFKKDNPDASPLEIIWAYEGMHLDLA